MNVRARLARLEVQCAIKPSRLMTDAELDADIARLTARLGIAHMSPAERELFLNEVSVDESTPAH